MSSMFNDFFNTKNDQHEAGQIKYLNNPDSSMRPFKMTATVSGKVQGVGFRYATLQLAQKLNVNGFVRNQSDGSVYIEASAKPEVMKDFINALAKGPAPISRVDKVVVEYDTSLPIYLDFKIQH